MNLISKTSFLLMKSESAVKLKGDFFTGLVLLGIYLICNFRFFTETTKKSGFCPVKIAIPASFARNCQGKKTLSREQRVVRQSLKSEHMVSPKELVKG